MAVFFIVIAISFSIHAVQQSETISHLKQFQVISCFQIYHSDACSVVIYCNLIPNLIESTPERILFPNQYIPNSKY